MAQMVTPEAARALIGTDLGTSDWVLIDQAKVNAFANVTGDHQFIHVDPEAAGLSVQALIQVRVHSHRRDRLTEIFQELRELPGVQQIYIIGGDRDFVMQSLARV